MRGHGSLGLPCQVRGDVVEPREFLPLCLRWLDLGSGGVLCVVCACVRRGPSCATGELLSRGHGVPLCL